MLKFNVNHKKAQQINGKPQQSLYLKANTHSKTKFYT